MLQLLSFRKPPGAFPCAADDLATRGPALQALGERVRIRPDAGLEAFAALWRATRDANLRQQLLNVWSRTNRVPAGLAAMLAEDLVATSGQLDTLARIVARAGTRAGVNRFVTLLEDTDRPRSRARRTAVRSLAGYGARAKPAIDLPFAPCCTFAACFIPSTNHSA